LKFYDDFLDLIKEIPKYPFKHRQSIYSDDANVRDLIFKGYAVTFRVNEHANTIEVFSLIKYQKG